MENRFKTLGQAIRTVIRECTCLEHKTCALNANIISHSVCLPHLCPEMFFFVSSQTHTIMFLATIVYFACYLGFVSAIVPEIGNHVVGNAVMLHFEPCE